MNGVIILDKPPQFTSFDAVAVVRGIFHEKRVGHTGTLDPMATGVLPIMLGQATGAIALLEDTEKEYQAQFALGQATDTQDSTGRTVETGGRALCRVELEAALPAFRGDILQVPPMYSAVSVHGQRLYTLARQGIQVERPARPVHIAALDLLDFDEAAQTGALRIVCSKGTYIRTLIDDLARAAGSLGCMTALRRTRACGFVQEQAVSLEELRALAAQGRAEEALHPVESLFAHCRRVVVTPAQVRRFGNGNPLAISRLPVGALAPGERVRVCGAGGAFIGIGEAVPERDELVFRKLFCTRDVLERENGATTGAPVGKTGDR